MRIIFSFLLSLNLAFCVVAQVNDIQKLIDSELSFDSFAKKKGTNAAFLEFLADDGLVFRPDAKNGKEFFRKQEKSNDSLSWQPKFAELSSNALIGFTTGDWQYSKEKSESPSSFGQYVSIWQRQQNGEYRVILDIGISHEKPKTLDLQVKFGETGSEKPTRFASFISDESVYDRSQFVSMYDNIYKKHFADDVRVLRDGKLPIIGKKNALNILKKDVSLKHFPKLRFSFGIADFAYGFGTYESPTENGNFVQIWKYRKGKWQIILDVMAKY
jgi:ketosteroid isomerase-like protein